MVLAHGVRQSRVYLPRRPCVIVPRCAQSLYTYEVSSWNVIITRSSRGIRGTMASVFRPRNSVKLMGRPNKEAALSGAERSKRYRAKKLAIKLERMAVLDFETDTIEPDSVAKMVNTFCAGCGENNVRRPPDKLVIGAANSWYQCVSCGCVFTGNGWKRTIHGYVKRSQWKPSKLPTSAIIHDDLYVMQNEHGLIKVGRSQNPEARRASLQRNNRCRVELILVLPGKGDREEATHRRIGKFRMEGEWYEGTANACAAVARTVKRGCVLSWPFAYNADAAELWLDQFSEHRVRRYDRQRFQKLHSKVRHTQHPSRSIDSSIWEALMFLESGEWPLQHIMADGEPVGIPDGDGPSIAIPRYTFDLDAAMSLWPRGERPPSWKGTALECCVAALELRRTWRFPRTSGPARSYNSD